MCDVAYKLMVNRIERWAMVGQIAAVLAKVNGGRATVKTYEQAKAEFDDWLLSPLEQEPAAPVDAERAELEAALGVT